MHGKRTLASILEELELADTVADARAAIALGFVAVDYQKVENPNTRYWPNFLDGKLIRCRDRQVVFTRTD